MAAARKPRPKAPTCKDSLVKKDEGYSRAWCPAHGWWVGPRRQRDQIGGWSNPERPGKKAAQADAEAHAADGTSATVQDRFSPSTYRW